ncbi:hypothetical protein LSCM1_03288 [Leishmania martiniquensis]|uniref:ATP-dependent DNA helicase n=1 Tax=Leishmania martiniquensis TaxID=1580590 RepID=A0A836KIW0_9TRYP|nr:hypothetical protein LSCM1_03288 [Leishmania martiniquensis]
MHSRSRLLRINARGVRVARHRSTSSAVRGPPALLLVPRSSSQHGTDGCHLHALTSAVRRLSLRLNADDEGQRQFAVSFRVGAGSSSGGGAASSFAVESNGRQPASSLPGETPGRDAAQSALRFSMNRGALAADEMATAASAPSPTASVSGGNGRDDRHCQKSFDISVAGTEANAVAAAIGEAPCGGSPPLLPAPPLIHPPGEEVDCSRRGPPAVTDLVPPPDAGGGCCAATTATSPCTTSIPNAASHSIKAITATHALYSGLFQESFVNPFNGRLVGTRSSSAKILLGLGFYRGVSNPLQLEWNPAEYMARLQKMISTQQLKAARLQKRQTRQERVAPKAAAQGGALSSAAKKLKTAKSPTRPSSKSTPSVEALVPAEDAIAVARSQLLRPLRQRGPKHWMASVATLLERQDAFTYINKELERLYARLGLAYMPPKLDTPLDPSTTGITLTPDQQHVMKLALRGYNLFVGGSAGTGKTVLLKSIYRELCQMGLRVAMTATTGVAAVQLGGCTFHHAFNAPLDAVPHRWDANALRAVDVVMIDEVSLLDACMLDAFDMEARLARMHHRPFGGLQLIVCGDFLQLSRDDTPPAYESVAFNHLLALRLVTPMRHAADDPLMKLLEDLRHGRFDAHRFAALDRPIPADATHITYLFPRRREAQELNDRKLGELTTQEMTFTPQRGPLQLCGTFTRSALVELGTGADGMRAAMPPRERVLEMIREEALRLRAGRYRKDSGDTESVPLIVDHELVLMPVRADGTLMTRFILRLRCREGKLPMPAAGGGDDAEKNDDASSWLSALAAGGTPGPTNSSTISRVSPAIASDALRNPIITIAAKRTHRSTAPFSPAEWEAIAAAIATRLGGRVVAMLEEEPPSMVPLSVSMTLADMTSSSIAFSLAPLRLKLGCRVMVNRNLSRTVSNGSVGVVEAFAPPDVSLFPRRTDRSTRLAFKRLQQQGLFAELPIVRLLGGEVVQIPPISTLLGGTAQSYFYGHEVLTVPLQLGYAFTVHKVQGLTLQGTVVLDCEKFFDCAHLIYVACSRVRQLDQLVVYHVQPSMIIVRRSALAFSSKLQDARDASVLSLPPPTGRSLWSEHTEQRIFALSQ